MELKLPLNRTAGTAADLGKMDQSPVTPSSPANYDFLMRRASAVYEAQFEVKTVVFGMLVGGSLDDTRKVRT